MTGDTSKNRVAVWRELRKIGAAPVTSGVWTVPDTPHFTKAVAKVAELAGRGSGDVLVLPTTSQAPGGDALRAAFMALRLDEWREFSGDCAKFEAEIAKEIRIEKFTLAELEEEEQSLERLRRWHRELKSRDVLELPEAQAADELLRQCVGSLEGYAEQVYATLHAPTEPEAPDTGD
ncbi:chromate resistance protein ChrB [Paeniglutamicibacter sulfureus]|uniref:Chromate resistance protein ChrB n=1 Tax=Paeniglutamicibacter sulfureus TaxID=43666 RepID=UPI002665D102|nr:Chromate resistance protein ChrB [Paeniglutamicibacter sulfureus]MDO2934250.1 chromate resistance protein ChrB [Paeniglutamicibacter sulfureus]